MKLLRLIVSDLHLGTGVRKGELNPWEDFFHDDRFADMLAHHASEARGAEIELILNGDIFDLLKVSLGGRWPTEITEEIAVEKLRLCLEGHPRWCSAIKELLAAPGRRLTYIPGNHDGEMFFPGAQALFRRYVAPGPLADRVRFITQSDTYYLPEGIQIRHGHQLEAIHRVEYDRLIVPRKDGAPILNLPWGSLFILEILNPAKRDRWHIDRVQPFSRFMAASLLFDFRWFVQFFVRMSLHYLRHRVLRLSAWRDRLRRLRELMQQEVLPVTNFDVAAERALRRVRGVHTLIVGHSHGPRCRRLSDGKLLINTGTWTKMINLDLQHLGQDSGLTYCTIEYTGDGQPQVTLRRWVGITSATEVVHYAA